MEENKVVTVGHYTGIGKSMWYYAMQDAEAIRQFQNAVAQGLEPQIIVIDSMASAEKQYLDDLKEADLIEYASEKKKNHEPFWKGIKGNAKHWR